MQRVTKIWIAVVVIAGAATTGGIVGWQQWQQHQAVEQAKASLQALEDQVKAHLKDPDSAKFRDVRLFSHLGAICGSVNARNSMGGYVGFTKFVLLKRGEIFFEPDRESNQLSLDDRVEVLQRRIGYLRLEEAQCVDEADIEPGPKK